MFPRRADEEPDPVEDVVGGCVWEDLWLGCWMA